MGAHDTKPMREMTSVSAKISHDRLVQYPLSTLKQKKFVICWLTLVKYPCFLACSFLDKKFNLILAKPTICITGEKIENQIGNRTHQANIKTFKSVCATPKSEQSTSIPSGLCQIMKKNEDIRDYYSNK